MEAGEFASGSEDGIIKLWSGKDGATSSVLKCSGKVRAMAFSSSVLAASTGAAITLWDLKCHSVIATLNQHSIHLKFSHHHSLLAAVSIDRLALWDTAKRKRVTTFNLPRDNGSIYRTRFLPDDSQLAVHYGDFYLYKTHGSRGSKSKVSANQDISRISLCTSWHGVPTYMRKTWNEERKGVVGRFPQQKDDVIVFDYSSDVRVSRAIAEGSSMIALVYEDGRIIILKAV